MSGLTRRQLLRGAAATGLAMAGGALVASCQRQPLVGAALPRQVARLGFLALTSAEDYSPHVAALRAGLRDLGYVVGTNLSIEERYAQGREDRLFDLALELTRGGIDVLVAAATQASLAALKTTSTTPIVFTNSGDPLGAGLVSSLARPGGNATGLSSLNRELAGKRIELLRSAAPSIKRLAVLWSDAAERDVNETRTSAFWLGLQAEAFRVSEPAGINATLERALASRPDALVAISTPLINSFAPQITDFAFQHRLPSISEQREFVTTGGLLAYGANAIDLTRRAAIYVDKILAGARPADLPVERAERFELAINLRTAQSLSLVLPQTLLLQASEVVT